MTGGSLPLTRCARSIASCPPRYLSLQLIATSSKALSSVCVAPQPSASFVSPTLPLGGNGGLLRRGKEAEALFCPKGSSMGRSSGHPPLSHRCQRPHYHCASFCSTAVAPDAKLLQVLQGEIAHEKSSYEPPANVNDFLKKTDWTFEEKNGDVNMSLSKLLSDGRKVLVEFQLVSPFQNEDPPAENNSSDTPPSDSQSEMTDFTVSVMKQNASGVTFYCSTLQNDESFRYMIGNVRQFRTEEERNSVSGYNGPEFEDLDDKLQSALDEWLESLGVNSELCDFIDAVAVDKEQKEYMYWLQSCADVLQK